MVQEYEENLLRFLIQDRTAKRYFGQIDSTVFATSDFQLVYEMAEAYVKEFNAQPEKANLLQYFDEQAADQNLNVEVRKHLEKTIRQMYEPMEIETTQIRKTLIEFCQRKMSKDLIKEFAPKINKANDSDFASFMSRMGKITRLREDMEGGEENRGKFLLADHSIGSRDLQEAAPSYLKALNNMTSAKGFYTPQLIIFMAAPKAFKTGTMINLAVGYVRDGYNVYYADCENGEGKIDDRAKQCMLGATWDEIHSGEFDDKLNEIVKRFKVFGGDMRTDFYPPKSKTMMDVEAELEYLWETYAWKPHIIIYDYLDLFKPINAKVTEKRLAIQEVYFDAIRLNKKLNTFAFSLSQVTKEAAVKKRVIDMGDFAEDFGKAANAHAAFALCQDADEEKLNIARIIPVMQREGLQQVHAKPCIVYQDRSRMLMEELDTDSELAALYAEIELETKHKKKTIKVNKKNLADE